MAVVQKYFPGSPGDPRPKEPMSIWLRIDDVTGNDEKELEVLKNQFVAKVQGIAGPKRKVAGGITRTDKLKYVFRFL